MSNWIFEGRPHIHFAPKQGWTNDPNGLIFDGKSYHLFAQHNPHDNVWGPMHWLHAVSDDMLHWKELGIALYPDALGTMFSGSAVIDHKNTAGFGEGATIAMFTQHGERQSQSIAYSPDGEHFTVYEGNPVIQNPGIRDFRDPKVFWYEPNRSWRMVLAAGKCLEFYRSDDLKNWQKTGEFGEREKGDKGVYECPDLFALPGQDGQEIWVLLASIGAPPSDGGERTHYFLGEYDGEVFRQTEVMGQMLRLDAGPDNYAGVTYNGTAERLFMGWAAIPLYAGKVPAGPFRGCMTLPRTLSLTMTNAGLRLTTTPALPALHFQPMFKEDTLPDSAYVLRLKAQEAFEVQLCNQNGDSFRFGVDAAGHIFTDRTHAGASNFEPLFATPQYSVRSVPRLLDGPVEMTLVMDYTLAEIFADQGTYVHTSLLFPKVPYTLMRIQGMVDIQIAGTTSL